MQASWVCLRQQTKPGACVSPALVLYAITSYVKSKIPLSHKAERVHSRKLPHITPSTSLTETHTEQVSTL